MQVGPVPRPRPACSHLSRPLMCWKTGSVEGRALRARQGRPPVGFDAPSAGWATAGSSRVPADVLEISMNSDDVRSTCCARRIQRFGPPTRRCGMKVPISRAYTARRAKQVIIGAIGRHHAIVADGSFSGTIPTWSMTFWPH